MLTPGEGLVLDSEDAGSETLCAELRNPELVERDVVFRFSFSEGTASMYYDFSSLYFG